MKIDSKNWFVPVVPENYHVTISWNRNLHITKEMATLALHAILEGKKEIIFPNGVCIIDKDICTVLNGIVLKANKEAMFDSLDWHPFALQALAIEINKIHLLLLSWPTALTLQKYNK